MESINIKKAAQDCQLEISDKQAELFTQYYHYLQSENEKYNLTRITGAEHVIYEHFLDSFLGVNLLGGCPGHELLDLGAGAGFPGVPLKIFCPQLKLYLLESSSKKIMFLKQLIAKLELEKVYYLQLRAEELGRGEGRDKYNWVTARAVASLPVLAELALPLLKPGGYFWAFKGPAVMTELKAAEQIIQQCGGVFWDRLTYKLPPQGKERHILIFKKTGETENKYPRRAGIPQKRPVLKKDELK